jgi:chemotaxis protein MotB
MLSAAGLSLLLLLVLAGLQVRQSSLARSQAEAAVADARKAAELGAETNSAQSAQIESLRARIVELEEKIADATQEKDQLEHKMRTELESRDVTITELQGKLTVNILDRVLFDSGLASLKPEGFEILGKVAAVLAQFPNRSVQVVGHTDNLPVRNRTADGFTDNWSLSSGRALAAVRYLVEKGGVDPRRLSAVGCGEFKPIADNSTPEGRSRNRRIAVVVLPEEIGAADLPRPQSPTIKTNLPSQLKEETPIP